MTGAGDWELFLTAAPAIGFLTMTASGVWNVGCGWLVVPGLMLLGIDSGSAAAIALLQLLPSGFLTEKKELSNFDWKPAGWERRCALPLCLAGAAAACFGPKVNSLLTRGSEKPIQFLLLAAIVPVIFLLLKKTPAEIPRSPSPIPRSGIWLSSGIGGFIGLVSATIGIGGGVQTRPLLTGLLHLDRETAGKVVRLQLMVIPTAAGIAYLFADGSLNWRLFSAACLMFSGGVFGYHAGRWMAQELEKRQLRFWAEKSYLLIAVTVTGTLIAKLCDLHTVAVRLLGGGAAAMVAGFIALAVYLKSTQEKTI